MKTRSIIIALQVLAVIAIAMGNAQQRSQPRPTRVEDPVFGIHFDYTKIHYEPLPLAVRRACEGYETGSFWTFAHAKKDGKDYYVTLGVRPDQDGDSLGVILEVEGATCDGEDSTWMFSGFVPSSGYGQNKGSAVLPGLGAKSICDQGPLGSCHYLLRSAVEEEIIRALVADGIKRGVQAWGGETPFKQVACVPHVLKGNPALPLVREAIQQYCGVHQ